MLNTLAYPRGTTNEYRYTDQPGGGRQQVEPSARTLESIPCTIVFADRYSGYRYIPMRNGVLLRTYADGDRRHYRVKLGGFPKAGTSQDDLLALWSAHNAPTLTGNDPENPDDGYYALVAQTAVDAFADDPEDVAAWERIVKEIAATKAFADELKGQAVFVRLQIADENGRSVPMSSRGISTAASTTLRRSGRYSLAITYRYPSYDDPKQSNSSLILHPTENVRVLGSRSIPLDTTGNRIVVPFHFERFTKNDEGSIHLEANPAQNVVPTLPLIFRAKHSLPAYLQLGIAILLILGGAFIMGIDPTACDPIGPPWLAVIGLGLQLVAALLLIRNFGEKLI